MYRRAVEWLEDAGKDALAGDVFRCAVLEGRAWDGMGRSGGQHACRSTAASLYGTNLPPFYCVAAQTTGLNLHRRRWLPLPAPPCRQAVAQLLRAENWSEAVSMLLRFAASCDASGARNSQCKAYLGAVVVWLYAGKANDAWLTYQVVASKQGRWAGCWGLVHAARIECQEAAACLQFNLIHFPWVASA